MTALFSVTAIAAPTINQPFMPVTLISFFGAGILLAFTPCVLPMVPILSALLLGDEKISTKRAFKLSSVFVLSMAITYAGAGMLAGYLGSTLQTLLQSPLFIIGFSLIFIIMALSMFGLINLAMPNALQNYIHTLSSKQKRGSYLGVAMMGFLSTLIASPCVTAPLVSVLTYISQTGSAIRGGLILFTMALGMGLPLILFGIGQGAFLPKAGAWMDKVKFLFGVMMMGLAIWMLSRILPGVVIMFLWASLFIVSAVSFGALDFRSGKRLPPFLHGLSILTLIYGSVLLMGAASGNEDITHPLKSSTSQQAHNTAAPVNSLFSLIKNHDDMQQKLNLAKSEHKPVLVEFYASWCPACRALDKNVFADASIQQRMKEFAVYRVDITEKNDDLMQLLVEYNVYGTPTLIFFDRDGKEFNADSLDDGITKTSLMKVLDQLA